MSKEIAVQKQGGPSAMTLMASRYSVDPGKLAASLRETVFKGATDEQLLMLVVVANEYGLNPFTREVYAFPGKSGGIVPVIGIDGRVAMMQRHDQFDGIEFEFAGEGDDLECTATIWRKDRTKPFKVTEYLAECRRETEPWKACPRRMLRHKALIQCCRIAFAFGGIADEDDAREMVQANVVEVQTVAPAKPAAGKALPERKPEAANLEDFMTGAGVTFDEFRDWAERAEQLSDASSISSWSEIPKAEAGRLYNARVLIVDQIKGGGK